MFAVLSEKKVWRTEYTLKRKLVLGLVVVGALGGIFAVSTGISNAGEDCGGLDQALKNNLNFIADQQRNPDALSDARIANRQAVVDQIQSRRKVAGCTAGVVADGPAAPAAPAAPAKTTAPADTGNADQNAGSGDQVCKGQNVTFFNESAGPGASSGTFPLGTRIRVTNKDNNKSIAVTVTSVSGSCILLNNAAFDQVHEVGKNVIRNVVVEKIG
jgi:hypothetical protein